MTLAACDPTPATGDGSTTPDAAPRRDGAIDPDGGPDVDAQGPDAPPGEGGIDASRSSGPTCAAPPEPAPLVTLPCVPIPAATGCTAGPYLPVLRWSFDPAAPTDDAFGARDVASGLRARMDAAAVGGGFAEVADPDVPQTTGAAVIVPASGPLTIELLVRFRLPLDWSGSAGAGTGGRTQLLNLAAAAGDLELAFERDGISLEVGSELARFTMREGGVASWAALADGNFHHVSFVLTPVAGDLAVSLHVDGESPPTFTTTLAGVSRPAVTRVSFGRRTYDPHGIDIDELGLYASALPASFLAQHAREARVPTALTSMDTCAPRACTRPTTTGDIVLSLAAPGYDPAHLYAPSEGVTSQLQRAPLPDYRRGHTMPRMVASWITAYLPAADDPVPLTTAPASHQLESDTLRAPMAEELGRHWNYGLSAQLTGEARSRPDTNPYVLLLRAAPRDWPVDAGTGAADEGTGRLGLVNASGMRVGLSPGAALSDYRTYGARNAMGFATTEALIERPIDVLYLDLEGESFSTFESARDPSVLMLAANATARADCTRRGLAFRQCLAAAIADYRSAIAEGATSMLASQPAVHFYEVDGNEPYRGDFAFTRAQNDATPPRVDPGSDGSDTHRPSTSSLYPLNPARLYETIGASHGLAWYFDARAYEIANGSPFAMPYVAAGWSYNEHESIRPPQWLGFLQLVGVAGGLATVPAYFVIPTAVGTGSCSWGVCNDADCMGDPVCLAQTVQNPNHRAWQALVPSYAQAAVSREESLLRDPAATWLGELPTSGPHVVATGRRLGDRFLIAAMLLVHGNDSARFARTESAAWVGLDDDGVPTTPSVRVRLPVRAQGSLFLLDLGRDPGELGPTLVQLDAWHEVTHPSRWSAGFARELEAADEVGDLIVETEGAGMSASDFVGFTSFVRAEAARVDEAFATSPSAPYVELDVTSRAGGAHALWARARTIRGPGSVVVRVADGPPLELGCVRTAEWRWVRLDCGAGAVPALATLPADASITLRISPSHGGVEIDSVVLTPETSCIAEAGDCDCAP